MNGLSLVSLKHDHIWYQSTDWNYRVCCEWIYWSKKKTRQFPFKILFKNRIARADKIVADRVYGLCDQPLNMITSMWAQSIVSPEEIVKEHAQLSLYICFIGKLARTMLKTTLRQGLQDEDVHHVYKCPIFWF